MICSDHNTKQNILKQEYNSQHNIAQKKIEKFGQYKKKVYLCTRNLGMTSIRNNRGVAQPGSAPGLGPGGRRFESCRPDISKQSGCSAAR